MKRRGWLWRWGKPDFEALVQDMVGAFTWRRPKSRSARAAEDWRVAPVAGPWALTRLQQQEVRLARRSLGQLERLNAVADSVVDGQVTAVDLHAPF
ncbi:MAG: hypothetical protein H6641_09715 [Caldilineaceae bacterium]|nr:hypothetical protein [Caldilineaceae bacterium]